MVPSSCSKPCKHTQLMDIRSPAARRGHATHTSTIFQRTIALGCYPAWVIRTMHIAPEIAVGTCRQCMHTSLSQEIGHGHMLYNTPLYTQHKTSSAIVPLPLASPETTDLPYPAMRMPRLLRSKGNRSAVVKGPMQLGQTFQPVVMWTAKQRQGAPQLQIYKRYRTTSSCQVHHVLRKLSETIGAFNYGQLQMSNRY
jgi:hypothetical protein